MPFAVKVILVLFLVFLLEFYFFKKVIISIIVLFPKASLKKIRFWKNIVIGFINIYPIIAILGWVYVLVTKNGYFSPPQNIFFDYVVLYPFWIGSLIMIQSVLFFIIIDIFKMVLYPIIKSAKERILNYYSTVIIAILVLSTIYVPARVIYDYNSIDVINIKYKNIDLPSSLNGFKIALISDIQADRYTDSKRLMKFIRKLNSTNPDLVLIAGDMITNTPDFIDTSATYVGKIKSEYGVYSCVGDHDNWAYRNEYKRSLSEVTNALSKVNVPMIDNGNLTLGMDGANIEVTFITNTYVEKVKDNLLDSLTNNITKADLRIFLTHQPRDFLIRKAKDKNYDMYFCGHTHGGQLTFLFPLFNISPTMIETSYMRGEWKIGNMLMIVTKGLGMSLAPIRYNSTPEITIVTINK